MTQKLSLDYKQLFSILPNLYLIIKADAPTFTLLEANEAHMAHTHLKPKEFIGKPFFEVWPDVTDKYKKTGVSDVKESLMRVIDTGKPDAMGVLRYDIKKSNGDFEAHYWQPVHYPVFDDSGKVVYILQSNENVTDAKTLQQKLDRTQQQLDEALSAGLVGTWVWDLVEDKIYADKNLASIFGVSKDAAAEGLPLTAFLEAIHPEDRDKALTAVNQALEGGEDFEAEYRTIGADDGLRWVIARGRIEKDDEGNAVRFPGVLFDITDRRRAEDVMRNSEAELKFMAEAMPQKIFTALPNGDVDYFNPQWMEFTGRTFDDMKGFGWAKTIHPDDLEETKRLWAQAVKTGDPYQIEHRFLRHDGIYRWHLTQARARRDDNGDIKKWIGSTTDISDRKEQEIKLTMLADVSRILSSSLDYHSTLLDVANLTIEDMADWCAIDLYDHDSGLENIALVHKDPKKVDFIKRLRAKFPTDMKSEEGIAKVLRTGDAEYVPHIPDDLIRQISRNDEHYKLLKKAGFSSAIIVPLKIQNVPVGVMTLIRAEQKRTFNEDDFHVIQELADRVSMSISKASLYEAAQEEIKHRKRLEEALRIANEELEERVKKRTAQLEEANVSLERSNQELQDFAYVASHDLQEPLRKIQAFGNLLEEEYGSQLEDGHDYLERMRNAASRMSVLIQDLLAFSRVTTQARPFTEVDLSVIAGEVVDDLETRVSETEGKVIIKPLPVIEADPLQMRQLLQNLIGNALKFHRDGVPPIVKVSASPKKSKNGKIEYYILTIEDNGIGFDEKYLDRIFAVFQRLHSKDSYEGTGIGLAVCRKIVERHGGSIAAESIVGTGSKFIINLPARVAKES